MRRTTLTRTTSLRSPFPFLCRSPSSRRSQKHLLLAYLFYSFRCPRPRLRSVTSVRCTSSQREGFVVVSRARENIAKSRVFRGRFGRNVASITALTFPGSSVEESSSVVVGFGNNELIRLNAKGQLDIGERCVEADGQGIKHAFCHLRIADSPWLYDEVISFHQQKFFK